MKVLITGAHGQLGRDVVDALSSTSYQVFALGHKEMDITNQSMVNEVVRRINPSVIIHTAAYTNVDMAETEVEEAFLVNSYGTRNLVVAAEAIQAKICYISTDYVFDGTGNSPYFEYERPNPLGIYGKSKYVGEEMVKTLSTKFFIVRTAWVYGKHGNNFVKTMLKMAEEKKELNVVHDQVGSPTYTVDLATFLVKLISTEKYGIYHGTNSGTCSWFEFAKAIFEEVNISININAIPTKDYPRPAQRPSYSVLGNLALTSNGFQPLRPWRDALKEFIKQSREI